MKSVIWTSTSLYCVNIIFYVNRRIVFRFIFEPFHSVPIESKSLLRIKIYRKWTTDPYFFPRIPMVWKEYFFPIQIYILCIEMKAEIFFFFLDIEEDEKDICMRGLPAYQRVEKRVEHPHSIWSMYHYRNNFALQDGICNSCHLQCSNCIIFRGHERYVDNCQCQHSIQCRQMYVACSQLGMPLWQWKLWWMKCFAMRSR